MAKTTGSLVVGNLLKVAAVRYRDREMLHCASTGRHYTFGETNTRTNRLANGLIRLGIEKSNTVAFLCNNRAEIVETYLALAKIGAVGIPLNYRLAPAEIVDLVRLCEARAFLFAPAYRHTAETVHEQAPVVECFIGIGAEVPEFALGYERLLADSSPAEPDTTISEDDDQYLNLTSGTTGTPKAYLVSQYSNAVGAVMMATAHDLSARDVVLTVFPMFGRVGFVWTLIAIYMGAKNVIMDFEPKQVAEAVEGQRCSIVNLVPTMAGMLLALPDIDRYDLSSLRGVVFAGAPLPTSIREETEKHICSEIYEYYGLQETGACVTIGPEEKRARPESVGRIAPFCEVRVIDDEGKDTPTGHTGAIIVQSPASTSAYYNDEEKTRETFRDGWIHTGDLGSFDEDGFLYITGRTKDVIVSGGQNVFSVEVENVLLDHPAVTDCAVIGLPDPMWGETVTAVVVTAHDTDVSDEALIEHCKNAIAGFKSPKRIIRRTDPIPRTPTGKITKYSLVSEYTDG